MGRVGCSGSFESKTVQFLNRKRFKKNDGEGVFIGFVECGVGIWPPKTPSSLHSTAPNPLKFQRSLKSFPQVFHRQKPEFSTGFPQLEGTFPQVFPQVRDKNYLIRIIHKN